MNHPSTTYKPSIIDQNSGGYQEFLNLKHNAYSKTAWQKRLDFYEQPGSSTYLHQLK